jgi:general secretion pathway protein M
MSDKEDELRKQAKRRLNPKGWEALLEGVPHLDESSSPPAAPEDTAAGAPSRERPYFKITDESGRVSDKPTSPDVPEGVPKFAPVAPASGYPLQQEQEAPAGEPQATDRPVSEEPAPPGKKGPGRLWDKLRRQPLIDRSWRYYQGLNLREQRLILAALVFLGAVFIWSVILDPLMQKNDILNRRIQTKRNELAQMVRLRSSVVQDRDGIERIKGIIEQRGDGFSVFAHLEHLATKAEMKERIVHIKPQRETKVGEFRESVVEIKLGRITMEELIPFLYQIETSQDLLYIKNLKMKSGSPGTSNAGLEVTLSVGTLVQGR